MNRADLDERVYVDLRGLNLLQHRTKGLTFLPKQPNRSLLAGRHASRIRGRGLNFEEIRGYQPGDDVRAIDWKVTARTRSPHTRVFTEERDRPTLLIVDQRIGMFFGSVHYMKSVSAAQVSALVAWQVLSQGDRVGAVVFDDERSDFIEPRRSRQCTNRILQTIVEYNQSLRSTSEIAPNPAMLGDVLTRVNRLATHDHLVVVISDFHGLSDNCEKSLRQISMHNDMIGVLIHDPAASNLPRSDRFVVSNGELQVEVASGQDKRKIQEATTAGFNRVLNLQSELQAPILPVSTAGEVLPQLHRTLGTK